MTLQNYLANYSFLTLLGSMVFYWIETAFTGLSSTSSSPNVKNSGSVSALTTPQFSQVSTNFGTQSFAKYGVIFSNILLGLLLALRWKESGHFPLSNLYESLMFLSWCFTLLHLYIDFGLPNTTSKGKSKASAFDLNEKQSEFTRKLFGAVTTPSALFTNAFATFTLPKEMQEASPLVPALQSNWLMMHVTVMILSYAALILGSLLSIAFLIVTMDSTKNSAVTNQIVTSQTVNQDSKQGEQKNEKLQSIALTLDNLSYRILGIAFPLLTIGILSGAVWANEAWGSYWSWDPKETWALLTWLIFAIYLHTRISKGWAGKKPAIIASFGFVIVWICYLGVNLIGEGLHSYGWLTQS
jgi:cytochrome c-type biogenesis protein CcsB